MSKIYFRTIAYNAEKTLKRCVESVLNQAHGEDIVYYLCDNASTDHTGQMIREYAAQDHRIRAFFNLENHVWTKETEEVLLFPLSIAPEDYFCTLDADDEYFSDFLKVMLPFMQGNQLDIAACGIKMIDQRTSKFTYRQFSEDIVLTHSTFAKYFPSYHAFMRTTWGKLYTGRVTQHMYTLLTLPADILYGGDTLTVFSGLRYARKIGICSKVLHQYFISPKSLSCQYDSRRFTSDVYLYNDAVDFLKPYGPISTYNQKFLYAVYANAIRDTAGVIQNANLTPAEKLHEYAAIATHQITQMAYRCQDVACQQSREVLLALVCSEGLKLAVGEEDGDLQRALQTLLPFCGPAVTGKNLPVFLSEEIQEKFLRDDQNGVVDALLDLLPRLPDPQGYGLGTAIGRLAADKLLLFQIDDLAFLMKYPNLYRLVWNGEAERALDQMTGILLGGQVLQAEETFLHLYLNLSAQQGQERAFLFGKIQLACFYCKKRRWAEARDSLAELEEMGAGNMEEVQALRSVLEGGEAL